MNALPAALLSLAILATLPACAVHVHDDGAGERIESCAVHCGAGSRAEVRCEKPKIPACSCEPEVAAACISAQSAPVARLSSAL